MWQANPEFSYQFGQHKNQNVIWIKFPKSNQSIQLVKKLTHAKWSQTEKSWYVPDFPSYRDLFQLPEAPPVGKKIFQKIHPTNYEAFQNFQEELRLKAYSKNTQKSYLLEFAQFLDAIKSHPVGEFTQERIRSYFLYLLQTQNISETHLNSRINAIKFYYEKVLKRERFFVDIPRPKKKLLVPKVLSTQEIRCILNQTKNPKHRLILKLGYGMGLRVSEIVNLKRKHFDFHRMQVLIEQGKGKKDRYVILPTSLVEELQICINSSQNQEYLFDGTTGGAYSIRSVQAIFQQAKQRAGILKQVGVHSLRHSYATHLLEYGTDIRYIQSLLGHQSIKTTMNYTHVALQHQIKIKSPLDNLD